MSGLLAGLGKFVVGVPTAEVRGNITSHRARSTIASQLCNAKDPMTPAPSKRSIGLPARS